MRLVQEGRKQVTVRRFDVLKGVSEIKEFSVNVFGMAKKAGSPEKLAEMLSEELPDAGLQTIRSIAQCGDYPLSLDGIQK